MFINGYDLIFDHQRLLGEVSLVGTIEQFLQELLAHVAEAPSRRFPYPAGTASTARSASRALDLCCALPCPVSARHRGAKNAILYRVLPVRAFLRTSSQFLYVLSIVVALPCLLVLAWGMSASSRFIESAPLGLMLGQYAAAAAVATVTANAIAFLRPDDMAPWMPPFAAVLLVVFAGLMTVLFILS